MIDKAERLIHVCATSKLKPIAGSLWSRSINPCQVYSFLSRVMSHWKRVPQYVCALSRGISDHLQPMEYKTSLTNSAMWKTLTTIIIPQNPMPDQRRWKQRYNVVLPKLGTQGVWLRSINVLVIEAPWFPLLRIPYHGTNESSFPCQPQWWLGYR
jgi:hypothetical protein